MVRATPMVNMRTTLSGKGDLVHLRTDQQLTMEEALCGVRAFVGNAEGMHDDALRRCLMEGRTISDRVEENGRLVTITFRVKPAPIVNRSIDRPTARREVQRS